MTRRPIGLVTGQSRQHEASASQRASAQLNCHFRQLRLEPLENRRLLSAGVLPMPSGAPASLDQWDNDDFFAGQAEQTGQDVEAPPEQVESLLLNGGFETGDFTGWTARTNGLSELTPWTVSTAGGGFFFNSSPYEGDYSALNGFDGAAGLQYELFQDVAIPADRTRVLLSTHHRIVHGANGTGTQDRTLTISVRDTAGELLETLSTTAISPAAAAETDLGWQEQVFDVSAYAGETVRIHFEETIPDTYTGPAMVELDDIRLESVLAIDVGAMTPDLIEGSSSTVDVRLSGPITSDVTVSVARTSGDEDITASPTTLLFTPDNWHQTQPVVFTAAEDDDLQPDQAAFTFATDGLPDAVLEVVALDNDSFVVNTLQDVVAADGLVSLREALEAANTNTPINEAPAGSATEPDVIQFHMAALKAEAGPGIVPTIALSGTQLSITDDVVVAGPGSNQLTIDAGSQSRVIYVGDGSDNTVIAVLISGLTVTSGFVDGSENGGGIFNDREALELNGIVVQANTADAGGGICSRYGTLSVTNSTLSGNSADQGGGIYSYYGTLSVTTSTLSGNSASSAGGIHNSGDRASIRNSILWQNAGVEIGGPGGSYGTSNLIGVDPAFVRDPSDGADGWGDDPATPGVDESANDDYGDLRLTDRSFAIGYGDLSAVPLDTEDLDQDGVTDEPIPFDRDGNPRVFGGAVDCGAYEYQEEISERETPSLVVTTPADVCNPYDDQTSLREAIYYAGMADLDTTVTFDPAMDGAVITLDSGALGVSNPLTIDASSLTSLTLDADGRSRALLVLADGVVLNSLMIRAGHADYGGGIYSAGTLSVSNSTLSGNSADLNGGGIYIDEGTLSILNSTLLGNSAGRDGGGINSYQATLSVTNSKLSGNKASDDGGGIYGWGTLSITNSTLSGNSADDDGGGIDTNHGTLSLTDSTLSGNSARGEGGAIDSDVSTLWVTSSTLSGNSAGLGGAIHDSGSSATINNSIFWQNGDTEIHSAGAILGPSNLIGVDPTFVRDPSDGGDGWGDDWTTRDIDESVNDDYGDLHLTDRSIAINYGDLSAVPLDTEDLDQDGVTDEPIPFDRDGNPRVFGGTVDCGAYEYQNAITGRETRSMVVTTAADVWDLYDGQTSLREAICYAGTADLGTTVTFDATLDSAVITLASGPLVVSRPLTIDALSLTSLTVDAGDRSRAFVVIADNAVLDSLTIRAGCADFGAGICNYGTLSVTNSTLSGNSASDEGGGIYSYYGALWVTNSTLSGNSAGSRGGGIFSSDGALWVANSTLSGNSAGWDGGGIYGYGGNASITNSIVWRNSGTQIVNSYTGTSNLIDLDPHFVRNPSDGGDGWDDDPATPGVDESANNDYGDLRLRVGSPAIDVGDNASLPPDDLDLDRDGIVGEPLPSDLDGNPRIVGDTVDIGAYEYFVPATVAGRHVFYSNSHFDGNDAAVNELDDAAIAPDKQPLLPGDSAEFANYTSYSAGINGLMIDVNALAAVPVPSDFELRIGNDDQPAAWQPAPPPSVIAVRHGAGVGGSDRVTLIWPDGAIRNTWLQVIVKATPNTGLAAADVFYFGNAIGECGNSDTDAMVTSADEIAARHHPKIFTPAAIDNTYDFNRDGRVSAIDQIIARRNVAVFDALELIDLIGEMLLVNGGFETGDFTGWTARTNGLSELTPWTVAKAGGGFFYDSSPYEGDHSAINGFDGAAGLQYELFQNVTIPADRTRVLLSTHHRIVYTAAGTGTQDRTLTISVRDTAGKLLETLYTEAVSPAATGETDLGWQEHVFNLAAYGGHTVRIHFQQTIPDTYTGPAMVELDDIRLEEVLAIDVGAMATALVEGSNSTADVRLSSPITSDVTVSVARTSGDEDITVSPATLLFTPENWHQTQPVVFTATEDDDRVPDQATFTFAAEGLPDEILDVAATDDESYVVNTLRDAVAADGLLSLREALEAANTNAAVNEAPAGSATEADYVFFDMAALLAEAGLHSIPTISLSGTQLSITDDVVVAGPGTDELIIDAASESRVIYIGDGSEDSVIDVAISGLTITGGAGGWDAAGGMYNDREILELDSIAVRASKAYRGGGIYSRYGTLSVTNSTLSGNSASDEGGGIYSYEGTLSINNSTLSGNSANDDGGAIYSDEGTLSVTNSTLSGNSANDDGGAIYSGGNTLSVTNSMLSGNSATSNGGAIYTIGSSLSVTTVTNSTLSGNSARWHGGGVCSDVGTLSVTNSTLSGNSTRYNGGGIFSSDGTLWVTNSTLSGNSASDQGGGIYRSGEFTSISNSIFWQNGSTEIVDAAGVSGTSNLINVDPAFVRDPSDGGDGWGDDPATSGVDESANDDYGDLRLTERSFAIGYGDLSAVPLDTEDLDQDGVIDERIPFDRDGNPRVFGGSVDCGAYEYQAAVAGRETPSVVVTTAADVWNLYDGQTSLREALCYAGTADLGTTITFDAALDGVVVTLAGGVLAVSKSLTIDASSLTSLTVDGDGRSGVFFIIADAVVLDSLTIRGGHADRGAGVYSTGTLSITNSTLSGNSANWGGGVCSDNGTLAVSNSTLSGNSASDDGGGIYSISGTLSVSNSTLSGNSASWGSAIYVGRIATLTNSIFWRNGGTDIGGSVNYSFTSNLINVDPGFVRDPSDGGDGWGDDPATPDVDESINDDYGDLRLTDRSFAIGSGDLSAVPLDTEDLDQDGVTDEPIPFDLDGNPRVFGGTVDCGAYEYQAAVAGWEAPSVVVTTSADVCDPYDDQTSLREAIYYAGMAGLGTTITFDPALDDAVITLDSGALGVSNPLTIDASSLTSLTLDADGRSRVLLVLADDVILDSLTIRGGHADYGAGIYAICTLSVTNSTLSGNSARRGGAIYSFSGTLTVTNSTLSGNSAVSWGGGIYSSYSTLSVSNTVLSGNSASDHGGGIYSYSGTLWVTNSTLSNNSSGGDGGGIWRYGDSASISNSIFWQNSGTEIRGSYTGTSNLIGVDPSFVRNPSEGGDGWRDDPATPGVDESANNDYGDLRLQPGSPAIDAGDNAALPLDELDLDGDGIVDEPLPIDLGGNPRIVGGTVDIGAYEYSVPPAVPAQHHPQIFAPAAADQTIALQNIGVFDAPELIDLSAPPPVTGTQAPHFSPALAAMAAPPESEADTTIFYPMAARIRDMFWAQEIEPETAGGLAAALRIFDFDQFLTGNDSAGDEQSIEEAVDEVFGRLFQ